MAEYQVAFKQNTPMWKLYQELKRDGVKDADLDVGYPDTDYVHQKRTQIQAGDHVIQEKLQKTSDGGKKTSKKTSDGGEWKKLQKNLKTSDGGT